MLEQMADYEAIDREDPTFIAFWEAHQDLCRVYYDKIAYGITSDKLFTEEELEKEGEEALAEMTKEELKVMQEEI